MANPGANPMANPMANPGANPMANPGANPAANPAANPPLVNQMTANPIAQAPRTRGGTKRRRFSNNKSKKRYK
jgi:hypothetical protein